MKTPTCIFITPNGSMEVRPDNGTDFKLKELQNAVGGNIEVVYLDDDTILIVNEDGINLRLPHNHNAVQWLRERNLRPDLVIIHGNAVVCENSMLK